MPTRAPHDPPDPLHALCACRSPDAAERERAASWLGRHWQPDRELAVYGTLAPGERNHGLLSGLVGTWRSGLVRGRRAMRGYPVFTWDETAPPVPVALLTSDALPAHWCRIDEFEGDDYRRVLVPVRDEAQRVIAVANLYEAVRPVA